MAGQEITVQLNDFAQIITDYLNNDPIAKNILVGKYNLDPGAMQVSEVKDDRLYRTYSPSERVYACKLANAAGTVNAGFFFDASLFDPQFSDTGVIFAFGYNIKHFGYRTVDYCAFQSQSISHSAGSQPYMETSRCGGPASWGQNGIHYSKPYSVQNAVSMWHREAFGFTSLVVQYNHDELVKKLDRKLVDFGKLKANIY